MEQRTLKIGDRIIYCYSDGSVEWKSTSLRDKESLKRTFGSDKSGGYKKISLVINGKSVYIGVHRIIAMAFHSNPNNLPEVDHINRDPSDNRPENLRWVTRRDNNENRECIDIAKTKFGGIRHCDDSKAYSREYNKIYNKTRKALFLQAVQPNGRKTRYAFKSEDDPAYLALKPLSQKERYYKFQTLKP